MPLLCCQRGSLRFVIDTAGLVRVLSAEELARSRGRSLLDESLIPCDPALIAGGSALPEETSAPSSALLFHRGPHRILVSVDRVERFASRAEPLRLSLPEAIVSLLSGLVVAVLVVESSAGKTLLPQFDLAALWDDPAAKFAARRSTTPAAPTPLTNAAVLTRPWNGSSRVLSRGTPRAGLLRWEAHPDGNTELAVPTSHVLELLATSDRLELAGLPAALPGVYLWNNRLLPLYDPARLVDAQTRTVPLPYTLIVRTERPDQPLALALPTLPQRVRETSSYRPCVLGDEPLDRLLWGRFSNSESMLLVPAWDRCLLHTLLAEAV